jgi:hypothetical protein
VYEQNTEEIGYYLEGAESGISCLMTGGDDHGKTSCGETDEAGNGYGGSGMVRGVQSCA